MVLFDNDPDDNADVDEDDDGGGGEGRDEYNVPNLSCNDMSYPVVGGDGDDVEQIDGDDIRDSGVVSDSIISSTAPPNTSPDLPEETSEVGVAEFKKGRDM